MKQTILTLCTLALLACGAPHVRAQVDGFGLRTNLLTWALGSPGIGADISWNSRYMLVADGNYGDWNIGKDDRRIRHTSYGVGLRRYFSDGTPMWANPWGDAYHGMYLGIDGRYTELNQTVFKPNIEGKFITAGLLVGYTFRLRGAWTVDAGIGCGYIHRDYTEYEYYPPAGMNRQTDTVKGGTFGLTHLQVTLGYRF